MIIDITLIAIGTIGLIIASIVDIKTKEIPNWLNYSLISIGLGIRLLTAIKLNIWSYFYYALIIGLAMFLIGNLLYYTKQWGGGDTKLLTALGIIFSTHQQNLFLFNFLINLLIIGSFYGLIFTIIFAIKNKNKFKKEFHKILKNKNKLNKINLISSLIIIALIFLIPSFLIKIILILALLFFVINFYLLMFIKAVENVSLFKTIPTENLTEGDWITENIFLNKKLIYDKRSIGINKKQLNVIKKSKIKYVTIKEGIAFVPSFLITLIITLIFENLIFLVI